MEHKSEFHAVFSLGAFIVTISNDIQSFAKDWPTLSQLASAGTVESYAFQCRDYLEIWLETIGAQRKTCPFFVHVSDDVGNPIMMLPLGVERRNGIRFLEFLDGGVADYNAPVLCPSAARLTHADVVALWRFIRGVAPSHDVMALAKIPRHVAGIPNPLYELAAEPWPASGYFLTLEPGNRALERSTYAADNRRQRKRVSEIGELKFRIAGNSNEISDVFEIFVRQKSRRFLETGAANGLTDSAKRAYYSTLAQRLSSGQGVQLSYLSVGDDVVATHWGLVAGRRFYYLMPAYEAGVWRKFSPGRLLMEELVAWSSANNIAVFDLGIGDEDYKLKWRAIAIPLSGGLFARTLAGKIYCAAMRVRSALKRHAPPTVIRAIGSVKRKLRR